MISLYNVTYVKEVPLRSPLLASQRIVPWFPRAHTAVSRIVTLRVRARLMATFIRRLILVASWALCFGSRSSIRSRVSSLLLRWRSGRRWLVRRGERTIKRIGGRFIHTRLTRGRGRTRFAVTVETPLRIWRIRTLLIRRRSFHTFHRTKRWLIHRRATKYRKERTSVTKCRSKHVKFHRFHPATGFPGTTAEAAGETPPFKSSVAATNWVNDGASMAGNSSRARSGTAGSVSATTSGGARGVHPGLKVLANPVVDSW